MRYLWNEYLNGRAVSDDELGSTEDALRFLDIAEEGSAHDPWNGVDVPFDLIHPFTLGYLLAAREEPVDFADSQGFHLSTLIDSYQGEVLGELAQRVTESDFFIAIWSAHPDMELFPPRAEDMADHGFHLDELEWAQGSLLEHAGNVWPRISHAPAGGTLF